MNYFKQFSFINYVYLSTERLIINYDIFKISLIYTIESSYKTLIKFNFKIIICIYSIQYLTTT